MTTKKLFSVLLLVALQLPIPAGAAQKPVTCKGEVATIVGTKGWDQITGTPSRDVIAAGPGHDRIEAGDGDDLVCGGDGNDRIWGGAGADDLYGGAYYDYLYGEAGDDRLFGGPRSGERRNPRRDDIMSGGPGDDLLQDGAITFADAAGPVEVDLATQTATGEGADRLVRVTRASGSEFADTLSGTRRVNHLFGRGGDDVLNGFGGADYLIGHGGSDIVSGGNGPDALRGETPEVDVVGNDEYRGGRGRDRFILGETQLPTHVDLTAGRVYSEGADVISDVEDVSGSWRATNRLIGDEGDNTLRGGLAGDEIDGAGGDDVIYAECDDTDDQLFGGAGDDVFHAELCSGEGVMLDGGPGIDTFDYLEHGGGPVRVDLEQETFEHSSGSGSVVEVENVFGSHGEDVLIGNVEPNVLDGRYGEDELLGAGGRDVLHGGEGHDHGDGGWGRDVCQRVEFRESCATRR